MIGARVETQAPGALDSPEARAAYERARSFFERPAKERTQETFSFDEAPLEDPGVRTALWGTRGKPLPPRVRLSTPSWRS